MMEIDFTAVPQTEQRSSSEATTNLEYENTRIKSLKIDNTDKVVLTILKALLALFIAVLIGAWFCFMKEVVLDYVHHFHAVGRDVPEAVVIATITLGSTVMGGMTFILKGLFNSKD